MKKKENDKMQRIINNDTKKEVRDFVAEALQINPEREKEVIKKVIFDGRQFSVRIPRKYADAVRLNAKNDKFKFILELPSDLQTRPKLKAELIQE